MLCIKTSFKTILLNTALSKRELGNECLTILLLSSKLIDVSRGDKITLLRTNPCFANSAQEKNICSHILKGKEHYEFHASVLNALQKCVWKPMMFAMSPLSKNTETGLSFVYRGYCFSIGSWGTPVEANVDNTLTKFSDMMTSRASYFS